MIYTYLFTDKFFEDIRSNINDEQAFKIIEFFKDNFLRKENIFYCGTEKFLDRNHGKNGLNSNLLDHFLTGFISTGGISIFLNKDNLIDFKFCGNEEENTKNVFTITCEDILKKKDLKKIIKRETEDLWSNRMGKDDLIKKLNKLFSYSKSVFFVDRHVPGIVADNIPKQISEWNKSLKFFNHLISKQKTKTFFVNGVNNKVLDRYKGRSSNNNKLTPKNVDEINLEPHEMLKNDLHNFYKVLKEIKTQILIKDKNAYYSGLHDRFIFFFFDDNHILKKSLDDDTLLILDVTQGLNILDGKGKTTLSRRLTRQNKESSIEIVEEWMKNVENKGLFYKFVAGEEIIAS